MITLILCVLLVGLIVYILNSRRELPEYYHAQVLLVDLIAIVTKGTPADFDRWTLRIQEYPHGRPKYDHDLAQAHTGKVITPAQLSTYLGLRSFVKEQYDRKQGTSIQEIREQIERERERMLGDIALERERLAEEINDLALKKKSQDVEFALQHQRVESQLEDQRKQTADLLTLERERMERDLAFEHQRMERGYEQRRKDNDEQLRVRYEGQQQDKERELRERQERELALERQYGHERSMRLLSMISASMRTVVLAQVELRNNPAVRDIVDTLQATTDELMKYDPAVQLDKESVVEMVQQRVLQRLGLGDG